jgi:hypothetical protein
MSRQLLCTHIPNNYISTKMTLDNYDGLVDQKHAQNIQSSLELVIQDSNVTCKILPTTFIESLHVWYNNLESDSIISSGDFCTKLVAGLA